MLSPKPMHILGCLAFSEKNCQKKTLCRSNHFLKIQWNPFFDSFRYWPKLFKKKSIYEQSLFKSVLEINFWLWEVVKLKIHKYVYLCIFCLTTSQRRKLILKADLKRECPNLYSKFFVGKVLVIIFKSKKKWVSHYIFKKWFNQLKLWW